MHAEELTPRWRNRAVLAWMALMLISVANERIWAQFSAGSDGSDGALSVTEDTTMDLPADGIFHFTTVTVMEGVVLRFNRNPANTSVFILASGDVIIDGTISVSGGAANQTNGGLGGPG